MRPVTIIDVARAAGVSKTTASDALRDTGRVAPGTRAAVLEAAERLGFEFNRSARSLRTATTGNIGLYLPQALVPSEYYLAFLHGIVSRVAHDDIDVVLSTSQGPAGRRYRGRVDGIVVCDPRGDDPAVAGLLAGELPVVTCEPSPDGAPATGLVWSDPDRWCRRLLDHLAGVGATRPALLATTTQSAWVLGLCATYQAWCRDRHVTPAIATAPFGSPAPTLRAAVTALLTGHADVDAIVCVGDAVATAIQPAIADNGRRAGHDLLVASCSEAQLPANVEAVINTRGGEAGTMCAALLLDLLHGHAAPGTARELELELLTAR